MKLLALDTSTETCSVALTCAGDVIERVEIEPRHGERLLAMVQEVLAQAGLALTQLDAIAFGRGPGSFTSLRIGAGVVQGLAFGADIPVVPVSSLAALAQGAQAPRILAALDARMQQVYWGAYVCGDDGLVTSVADEIVVAPAQAPLPHGQGWIGAGSGWDVYHATLVNQLGDALAEWRPQLSPQARAVAQLGMAGVVAGHAVAPELALPVYLRDDVAAKARK